MSSILARGAADLMMLGCRKYIAYNTQTIPSYPMYRLFENSARMIIRNKFL